MLLRQFVAGFVLVIFMAQTFSNAIIVADYNINTSSFAAQCENKNKPQMHCNGQCQMVKQMEKDENGSKPFSAASKEKNNPDFFGVENANDLNTSYSLINIELHTNVQFCLQQCITDFFHPPSAV